MTGKASDPEDVTTDRRQLLRLAAAVTAGGAAAWAASCGGGDDDGDAGPTDTTNPQSDVAVLNAVLDLEHLMAALYPLAAARLAGEARALARAFAAHEREHARRLTTTIERLGGAPNGARPAEVYAEQLAGVRGERAALGFLADLEETALAGWGAAVPRLSDRALRQTAAAVLACQAEHLAALRAALGELPALALPTEVAK